MACTGYFYSSSSGLTIQKGCLDDNLFYNLILLINLSSTRNMILGNVIRNCLRQDSVNKILFLRFIKLADGSQRVLRMTMVLPTFAETKVGRADGLS